MARPNLRVLKGGKGMSDDGMGDFGGIFGEMPPGLPASGLGQASSDPSWTGTVTPGGGTGTTTDPITGTAAVAVGTRKPFRVGQPATGNGVPKPKVNWLGWIFGLTALAAGGYAMWAWRSGWWPFKAKKARRKASPVIK